MGYRTRLTKRKARTLLEIELSGREEIADWIETCLLVGEEAHIGFSKLNTLGEQMVETSAQQIALAAGTIERRAALIGDHYPFEIADDYLKVHKGAEHFAYTALLMMTGRSPAGQLLETSTQQFQAVTVLFEELTEEAVRSLLGPGSEALRFGHPSDIGRPSDFQEAIVWLAGRLGVEVGDDYKPPQRKDGGVDVVGWRPFPDGRSGMPLMLVQCTLQKDFANKAADVDPRHWTGWLKLRTPPTTVLAIPGPVPVGEKWEEISAQSMILDRSRLAGLLGAPGSLAHIERLAETTANRIEQLSALMDEANW